MNRLESGQRQGGGQRFIVLCGRLSEIIQSHLYSLSVHCRQRVSRPKTAVSKELDIHVAKRLDVCDHSTCLYVPYTQSPHLNIPSSFSIPKSPTSISTPQPDPKVKKKTKQPQRWAADIHDRREKRTPDIAPPTPNRIAAPNGQGLTAPNGIISDMRS